LGSVWGLQQLIPHPDTPSRDVERVDAQILGFDNESLFIEFTVKNCASLVIPDEVPPVRTDGLWQTTCFEAFLKSGGSDAYLELNFSPSLAWAAYSFDRYREGMKALPMRLDPEIIAYPPPPLWKRMWHRLRHLRVAKPMSDYYFLSAEFDVSPFLSEPIMLGLSAVIEETDGTKSYWALAHPPGKPDFHDPACFALELPAPQRP
jgi:hypothetical protein